MPLPNSGSKPFQALLSVLCFAALLTGCGGSAFPVQTPPAGTAVLVLSASSLTFAVTTVGSSSAAQTLTLSSTGTGTATVNITAITVSDTTDYTLTSNCSGAFSPGTSCTVTLTFTPKSVGTLPATIAIADNLTGSPQTVAVTGSGSAAPAPQAVLSPSSAAYTGIITNTGYGSSGPAITLSNPGNATLTGIALSLSGSGAGAFSISPGTSCGATLAAGANCGIFVRFSASTAGTYNATLSVADSAIGSPQTASLTGVATSTGVTLSSSSITFPSTPVGTTSAASSVMLTNSGSAPLTLSGITLGGTNPSDFATTNGCGATLAVGANCNISATFTPAAAQSYTAILSVVDNAPGTPQTITLSATGTNSLVTRTLLTFPATFPESLPDATVNQLYTLINNAQKSIDMTMYELVDTTFSADLVAACGRGVKVRVLLDASLEKSSNTAAYNQLNTAGANCSAVFSNTAFQATHQKSILIDGVTSVIMTLNLTSRYYTTTRDFALIENDPADYAAIEATFNADLAAGTPYGGAQGASDLSYTPALGDDLIWSPTTAQAAMLALINNAKSTLLIENEELSSSTNTTIVAALSSACQRGVVVHFTIVDESNYEPQFTTIKNAGCSVHTYPDTSTGFYVHAKVVVADYGLSTQNVYLGSINYSSASMNQNRELGMYLSDSAAVQTLYTTLTSDYNGGSPW